MSFLVAKEKILIKHPEGSKISDDDKFTINDAFNSKQKRIKINPLQKKETVNLRKIVLINF